MGDIEDIPDSGLSNLLGSLLLLNPWLYGQENHGSVAIKGYSAHTFIESLFTFF